jgi:hypothetical protein
MCVVSNMGDIGHGIWPSRNPWEQNPIVWPSPSAPAPAQQSAESAPTPSQFEAFDKLLRAAIEFDKATGQAACETAVKTAWINKMYEHFGLKSPL